MLRLCVSFYPSRTHRIPSIADGLTLLHNARSPSKKTRREDVDNDDAYDGRDQLEQSLKTRLVARHTDYELDGRKEEKNQMSIPQD